MSHFKQCIAKNYIVKYIYLFLFRFVFQHLCQKIKSAPLCIYLSPEAELIDRLLYYWFVGEKKVPKNKKMQLIFQFVFCRLVRINTISSHVFDCSVSFDLAQWAFMPIYSWANFACEELIERRHHCSGLSAFWLGQLILLTTLSANVSNPDDKNGKIWTGSSFWYN